MIGLGAFWIVLLLGAAWVGWGPARWREPGLAVLAVGLVGWHDPVALLVYLGLAALVGWLVRGGRPARGVGPAVIALAVGLAGCKWLQASSLADGGAGPLGLSYLIFRLIHVVV